MKIGGRGGHVRVGGCLGEPQQLEEAVVAGTKVVHAIVLMI